MKAIGSGLYTDHKGAFFYRGKRNGKPFVKKLESTNFKRANEEADSLRKMCRWKECDVTKLLRMWRDDGFRDGRLNERTPDQQEMQRDRISTIAQFFGTSDIHDVRAPDLLQFAAWRKQNAKFGTGARAAELDIQTLSNAFEWGVAKGLLDENPIRRRPRIQRPTEVRHSREVAPASIGEVHRIAARMFEHPRSQVLGWQLLFEALTGARTNEILAMEWDADEGVSGWYNGNALFIRRSKGGVNPWIQVTAPLTELMTRFIGWRLQQPESKWYFPGQSLVKPVGRCQLTDRMEAVCKELGFPKRTSHGLRSFYVTTRRSQGAHDAQIAAEIGDKTVSLISTVYGDRPPNWVGGDVMTFNAPTPPAWEALQ